MPFFQMDVTCFHVQTDIATKILLVEHKYFSLPSLLFWVLKFIKTT